MPVTVVTGTRSTEAGILSARKIVDMSNDLRTLEGDKMNFYKFASKLPEGDKLKNIKASWLKNQVRPKFDTVTANVAQAGTSVSMTGDATNAYHQKGDVLVVPSTGEHIRVTAKSGLTLTVVRAVGTTAAPAGAASIPSGEQLMLISRVYGQGSSLYSAASTTEEELFNYLQLQRDHYDLTGTHDRLAKNGGNYGGPDRDTQRMLVALEHARALNHSLLLGERYNGTDETGAPLSTSAGVRYYMDTANVVTGSTTLTDVQADKDIEPMMRYGSEEKWLVASRPAYGVLNRFGWDKQRFEKGAGNSYGMRITKMDTSHGTINMFTDTTLEGPVYKKAAFVIDPRELKMRHSQKTILLVDRRADGSADKVIDEFMTEFTLEAGDPQKHGGWTNLVVT